MSKARPELIYVEPNQTGVLQARGQRRADPHQSPSRLSHQLRGTPPPDPEEDPVKTCLSSLPPLRWSPRQRASGVRVTAAGASAWSEPQRIQIGVGRAREVETMTSSAGNVYRTAIATWTSRR